MIVQVLSIEPSDKLNVFDVKVLVGIDIYTFEIEIEVCKVGEDYLQVASSGRYLWQRLQHNPGAVSKIYKLALKVYNGQEVELPAIITEHLGSSGIRVETANRKSNTPLNPLSRGELRPELPS